MARSGDGKTWPPCTTHDVAENSRAFELNQSYANGLLASARLALGQAMIPELGVRTLSGGQRHGPRGARTCHGALGLVEWDVQEAVTVARIRVTGRARIRHHALTSRALARVRDHAVAHRPHARMARVHRPTTGLARGLEGVIEAGVLLAHDGGAPGRGPGLTLERIVARGRLAGVHDLVGRSGVPSRGSDPGLPLELELVFVRGRLARGLEGV
eukprot:CAMPEP_0198528550 /NCGR_PEP_ID=MMETSP1462-20131121/25216_1 /TAXON_ID=1333877 /ORGANISM="Brandtodinium nutriculum, Strain RCC3387" /LENGTH=213 /DNA_ID=CAMNT_0044258375 /DNA_START=20 /DNA_END=658 /DNA_ORIENTATION=-